MPRHKAPLALAAFLALPLFFASLMATSLAIEKPHAYEWMRGGKLIRTFHDPTSSNEAKIWLLSFAAPLLLVAIGWGASYLRVRHLRQLRRRDRRGARADHRGSARGKRHHTARFPFGEDNYPDSSTSSLVDRGQWEHQAADTVHSLVGYTVGLALAASLIAVLLAFRRHAPAGADDRLGAGATGGAPTTAR